MRHIELAWTLAEIADQAMTSPERFDIYLALGAGEEDNAIQLLVRVAVRERIALQRAIVTSLYAWLEAYRDADREFRTMLALIDAAPETDAYQERRLSPEIG